MPKPKLTSEQKAQIDLIVARFNVETLGRQSDAHYITQYRGANLYLGHDLRGKFEPICRLTYTGDMGRSPKFTVWIELKQNCRFEALKAIILDFRTADFGAKRASSMHH